MSYPIRDQSRASTPISGSSVSNNALPGPAPDLSEVIRFQNQWETSHNGAMAPLSPNQFPAVSSNVRNLLKQFFQLAEDDQDYMVKTTALISAPHIPCGSRTKYLAFPQMVWKTDRNSRTFRSKRILAGLEPGTLNYPKKALHCEDERNFSFKQLGEPTSKPNWSVVLGDGQVKKKSSNPNVVGVPWLLGNRNPFSVLEDIQVLKEKETLLGKRARKRANRKRLRELKNSFKEEKPAVPEFPVKNLSFSSVICTETIPDMVNKEISLNILSDYYCEVAITSPEEVVSIIETIGPVEPQSTNKFDNLGYSPINEISITPDSGELEQEFLLNDQDSRINGKFVIKIGNISQYAAINCVDEYPPLHYGKFRKHWEITADSLYNAQKIGPFTHSIACALASFPEVKFNTETLYNLPIVLPVECRLGDGYLRIADTHEFLFSRELGTAAACALAYSKDARSMDMLFEQRFKNLTDDLPENKFDRIYSCYMSNFFKEFYQGDIASPLVSAIPRIVAAMAPFESDPKVPGMARHGLTSITRKSIHEDRFEMLSLRKRSDILALLYGHLGYHEFA